MSENNSNQKLLILIPIILILACFVIFGFYQNTKNTTSNSQNNSSNYPMQNGQMMNGMNQGGMNMNMSEMIKDDQSFIQNMIPHHQEAVDTSKVILAKSSDTELKTFATEVITAQEKEIEQMKNWYKQWFNTDYKDDGKYRPMMGDLNNLSGQELDKNYIKGMIEHHQGAVQMAQKILTLTTKTELKTLAGNIITTQNAEITALKKWLMSKYNDHSMMGM